MFIFKHDVDFWKKKHGLRSTFKFKCDVCNIIMFIESEKPKPENYLPINEAAVSGSISAGIWFTLLSELCATMDIQCKIPPGAR